MDRSEEELAEWMKTADARSLAERLERLKFVRTHYDREHGILFQGGLIPARAFEEMQFCYIHGSYISCVLTAQVVLEHMLAALLEWMDRDDIEGIGFARLCEEALAENQISQREFEQFNSLRRLRNPYTHSKPFMGCSCIIRRAADTGSSPEELFKADAEIALAAVIGLVSRPPFAVG